MNVMSEPIKRKLDQYDVVEWTDTSGATYRGIVKKRGKHDSLHVHHRVKQGDDWVTAETVLSERMCRWIPPEEL
jgi:hypothetical protein